MDELRCKDQPIVEFSSGAKRSDTTGRGRFDLISPHGLRRLALRYEAGARQKGERNWEGGFPVSRCVDSALRHLTDYLTGDRTEDHLAAVAWQMFAAMEFEEQVKAGRLPLQLLDLEKPPCAKT